MSRAAHLASPLRLGGSAAAQSLHFDGAIAALEPAGIVQLDDSLAVPRGALVYAFEPVQAGARQVGVLRGTFRVVRAEGLRLEVIPHDAAALTQARVGDRVQVDFTGPPGSVELESAPTGALMWWEGVRLGATGPGAPVEVELAPGDYLFVLEAPGFAPTEVEVSVTAGETVGVNAPLTPAPTARSLLYTANQLFDAGRYAEAIPWLERAAAEAGDGSLDEVRRRQLPVLRSVFADAAGMAERALAAGTPEAVVLEAARLYRHLRDNERDDRTVRQLLVELRRLLPEDPLVRGLSERYPPGPAGTGG
jgi:hypothetical protein